MSKTRRWPRWCWHLVLSAALALVLCGTAAPSGASAPLVRWLPQSVRVWVNTSSGVYHCAGSQYYGTTKRGTILAESDALAEGNRPARGKRCGPVDAAVPTRSRADTTVTQVWVNTSSGVYHCPGSRYYRATKRGQLLAESVARDRGYRPAYGRFCS